MPELPEVETVKRGLGQLIVGKKIIDVTTDTPKSFPNSAADIETFLLGASVKQLHRRGKAIITDLDSDYSLVTHLKMTGQLVFRDPSDARRNYGAGHPTDSLIGELPDRSTRVVFEFVDKTKLFFNDQRKFGWIRLLDSKDVEALPFLQKLGPEPLSGEWKVADLAKKLERRPRSKIKAAILDQTVVAGVGNIYADEALFVAKIHPATLVGDLTQRQLKALHAAIIEVMQISIDKGGSSSRNYVDALGKKGNYLDYAYVYGRAGEPCRVCTTPISKIKLVGRGTHFCPHCQPEPPTC